MTPQEELDLALAELADAEAELAAAQAGVAAAKKTARPKRPAKVASRPKREVHHSDLAPGCYGYGGPINPDVRLRMDMTPVVTKHLDAMTRPTRGRMPGKVSVTIYNDSGQQQGLAMTMMERESDRLEADLPFGWTIVSRKIA